MTAEFDAAEPWRARLGASFQDLVPSALDQQPAPRGSPSGAPRGALSGAPRGPLSGAPRGSLSGVPLGPVRVFTVSGTPQVVQRTTSAVRSSPGDLIKVCVQLHGRATVRQDSHEVALGPGELAVYDTGRPYQIRLEGAWTSAVMALPREAIGLAEADLDRWMHRVYPAAHGPGSVLSHFIVGTVTQTAHPGAAAAAKLGEAGSTLLASTLLDDADLACIDAAADLRAHVTWYLRAHLADPRLSRSSIAAAHHMSARTLDRLFAGQPWSVSGLIRHERLEAVRRDLEDPSLRHRSVAALAARWGFFDAAHFSRLFRQHYGYPPSQADRGQGRPPG